MTHDLWLAKHPYLQPIADFHAHVEAALADEGMPIPAIPAWDDYVGDFVDGVPLLHSAYDIVDLKPADSVVESLVDRLASNSSSGRMQSVLSARLRSVRPGRHCSEAVTLRHPVMPVANGLCGGWVGINGGQL
jgi:hypothetical protein